MGASQDEINDMLASITNRFGLNMLADAIAFEDRVMRSWTRVSLIELALSRPLLGDKAPRISGPTRFAKSDRALTSGGAGDSQ